MADETPYPQLSEDDREKNRNVATFVLIVFLLLLIPLLVFSFCGVRSLQDFEKYLYALNAVARVGVDVVTRLSGVLLAALGTVGLVLDVLRRGTFEAVNLRNSLLASGATLGLAGASFVESTAIDKADQAIPDQPPGLVAAVTPTKTTIEANWVQLVQSNADCIRVPSTAFPSTKALDIGKCLPVFSIREVVSPANVVCPSVTVEFVSGGSKELRLDPRQVKEKLWKPGDVQVCAGEIASGFNPSRVNFSNRTSIPIGIDFAAEGPRQVVALGDSGCRGLNNKPKNQQDCDNTNVWPFAFVAGAARKSLQDGPLVIHLGDFVYGEKGRLENDNWNGWNDQFFKPAKILLGAGPWVMVRGNHDHCLPGVSDSLYGFYWFFGTNEKDWCNSPTEVLPTYALDIAKNTRLIVADSSTVFCYAPENARNESSYAMDLCGKDPTKPAPRPPQSAVDMLASVRDLMPTNGVQAILATHVPVFGVEWDNDAKGLVTPGSSAAMAQAWLDKPINELDTILSGDRHQFLSGKLGPDGPLQMAIGTGGVKLDYSVTQGATKVFRLPPPGSAPAPDLGPAIDKPCEYLNHGFLLATRQDLGQYEFQFVAIDGEPRISCSAPNPSWTRAKEDSGLAKAADDKSG